MQAGNRNSEGVGRGNATAMSAHEQRTWSVLAHLSMFLNLFTGLLGAVATLVIWLPYRDRSRKVAFHAIQSMWYQIAWGSPSWQPAGR